MADIIDPYKPAAGGVTDPFRPATRPRPSAAGAAPVAKRPERSVLQAVGDTVLGVGKGVVNLASSGAALDNLVNPRQVAARAAVATTTGLLRATGNDAAATDVERAHAALPDRQQILGKVGGAIDSSQSEALQQSKQELAETEGFWNSAKKVVTDPRLLGNFVAEQIPNLALAGGGTAFAGGRAATTAGAAALESALARGLSQGAARTVAKKAAEEASKKAASRFSVGANTVMETGAATNQSYMDALSQPDEVWQANPEYQQRIARGEDVDYVKQNMARSASARTALLAAPISAVAGRVAAPFEADVFTGQLARRPVAIAGGIAREAAEEGVQEGGSQLATNVGVQGIDPTRDALEGVPEAAGAGAALGGVIGGGLATGGAMANRPQAQQQPTDQATEAAPAEPPPLQLRLPPPETFSVDSEGNAQSGSVRPEVYAEPEMRFPQGRGMSAPFTGTARRPQPTVTPAGEITRAANPAATTVTAPPPRYADAAPGSIADTANFLPSRPSVATENQLAAGEAAQQEQAAKEAKKVEREAPQQQAAPVAAPAPDTGRRLSPLPWVNDETGEFRQPTRDEVKAAIHERMNLQVANGTGINRPTISKSLGLQKVDFDAAYREVKKEREQGLTAPAPAAQPVDPDQRVRDQIRANSEARRVANETTSTAQPAAIDPGAEQAARGADTDAVPVAGRAEAAVDVPAAQEPAADDAGPAVRAPEGVEAATAEAAPAGPAATYDESPDVLDTDITPPSGGPFSQRAAADVQARRVDGGRVFEVDGGFVVRTPQAAVDIAPEGEQSGVPTNAVEPANDAQAGAARDVQDAGVSDLAERGGPLPESEQHVAPQLRGEGDQPAPGVGEQLSGVPVGSGEAAVATAHAGADRQRDRLSAGERPVGDPEGAGQQPAQDALPDARGTDAVADGVGRGDRAGAVDAAVPAQPGADDGARSAHDAVALRQAKGESAVAQSAAPKPATLKAAANEAATSPKNDLPTPTEAQKEAGNYRKAHVRINGHDISIENPAGSKRRPEWPALKNHYGYIRGTVGKDKDHVDVFLTDRADDTSLPVFVVDQLNADGSLDEHKVIMGAATEEEARKTYLANYSKGWTGLGGIKGFTQDEFKAWVRDPAKTKRRVTRSPRSGAAVPSPKPERAGPKSAAESTVDSPSFRKWFGDSMVVDPKGRPLVVYHGTTDDIDVFDSRLTADGGFHFGSKQSADQRLLRNFGEMDEDLNLEVPASVKTRVMPVYLAIQNPKTVRDADNVVGGPFWYQVVDAAKKEGFDGLRYVNEGEGGGESWVAFSPEQIKSATSNNGNFDKTDARILFSRRGWDESFPDVVTGGLLGTASSHADYAAAKAGDRAAALRLARDIVTPAFVSDVQTALDGSRPVIVPVVAREDTGNNAIPRVAAEVLAARLGLKVDEQIVQADKVGRGSGDAVYRLANQPGFAGAVKAGQEYLLIDDTLTQGGTLAQLKTHIEDAGGRVVLATALTGKAYSRKLALSPDTLASVRERFGSIETWWRGQFGYGFEGLTESEARSILALDRKRLSPDGLRDRVAAAGVRGAGPLDARAVGDRSDPEAPGPGGRQSRGVEPVGGLDFDRALQLKTELTKAWGDAAPAVVVVRNAEAFPDSAKADPDYTRAEGFYDGRPTVWINAATITSERRFAEVLAHEAIGHYGVEQILGAKEWGGIVDAIGKLSTTGNASDAMLSVLADVRKRYGDLDPSTYASEVLAVMAERGIRNSLINRVVAAVRRFLRRVMPSTSDWSENDLRALLGQADSFLRAGRNAERRQQAVQAYAFSRASITVDARGERSITLGGEKFVERGNRYYLVNGTGHPKDFDSFDAAWQMAQRTGGEAVRDDFVDGEAQTFSVIVPDEDVRVAAASRQFFSKPADEVLSDIDAVQRGVHAEGVLARARQLLADAVPKKLKDTSRPTWLGALTTRHLTELGADYFTDIKHYSDDLTKMQADRNTLQAEAEGTAENARQWASKNRAAATQLFGLMHETTIDGVDPSAAYQPLQFRWAERMHDATDKNVREAILGIKQQMRERSGDSKKDMLERIKSLNAMRHAEKRRSQTYGGLVARWNQLSPEAQQIYRDFRDAYRKRSDAMEEALVKRIADLKGDGVSDGQIKKMSLTIRQQFEDNRLQGVYFPLQRFGRFFVSATKGDDNTFLMFESGNDLERAVKDLRGRGWTIGAQGLKGEAKSKDAPPGSFVADIIGQLHKNGVSEKTQDDIYQIYLQALPELSMRKHQIHRKSVPGFDTDAVRAFAYNMHHGSHQLARLRYSHLLQMTLDKLRKDQDAARRLSDGDTRKIVAGDAIIDELGRRHEWIMNPQDSQLTNIISSLGFTYYLGATPAAALVNLTQTALVTYPYLASRHGPIRAMNYLLAASRDAARTLGNIQKTLTTDEERAAHAALMASGALDKTQAHNLAGIAEGGLSGYNPGWAKAMEIIGWGFHKTEVVNREASAMAAFRLARADGASFNDAVKAAHDAVFDTHFDYSNANRARFMQSGTAKVLLMFRQYSLNMTWTLGRMVWQATKGQTPEVKRIARRNLAGVLGMSALFSGVLGLPTMGVVMGTLNALQASFGDDDEPWDAETEFRAFLADLLGPAAASIVACGAANTVTGADIAGRVGLSDLWVRDADRELEGRGLYNHLLEQAAGPMGGVLKNVLVGKSLIDEGHTWRGVETMLPKGLKDIMKAGRYATQGVNTLRGDPLLEDSSLWNTLLQANGFTPAEVSEQYQRNRDLKNYEQHIVDRRQHLMNAFALALRTEDGAARQELLGKIASFNRANPELAITAASIQRSIQSRARYSAKAEAGIVINPKLAARLNASVAP